MRIQYLGVFALSFILFACTQQKENEVGKFNESYAIKKNVLGSFIIGNDPANTKEQHGVHWKTMHEGNLTIDDMNRVYVFSAGKILVYDDSGDYKRSIVLEEPESLTGPIEVSADGSKLFVGSKKDKINGYRIYAADGSFVGSSKFTGFIERSCKDVFWGDGYDSGKRKSIYLLDKQLNQVKNLNNYYLSDVPINQRPKGFFDAEGNFFYMDWWPSVTKLDENGKMIYQKDADYKAENWRLIGIDSKANLYALIFEAPHGSLVKLNQDMQVTARIPFTEEISNAFDDLADGSEVHSFMVTCNGDIYFIPNLYYSTRREYDPTKKDYQTYGEYSIYKFERIEQKSQN